MKPNAEPSGEFEDRLPNLIIPGAAKAGTTTIHNFLAQHPRIFLPRVKEPHFFSNDLVWERGVEAYVRTHFEGAAGFAVRAEATPHYLFYEKAAQRIAEVLPASHQRFVIVLRDPVARAYSLYWNMVHEGHETLSFEDALAREDGREGTREIERIGGIRWQYYDSGLYAKQLECWFQHFARERFLFVLTEDLQSDPEGTMDRVFSFVGLTPLLLERSLQAQFLIPMAISLAFGVLFATLITLVLVPSMYYILEDLRGIGQRMFKRRNEVNSVAKEGDPVVANSVDSSD